LTLRLPLGRGAAAHGHDFASLDACITPVLAACSAGLDGGTLVRARDADRLLARLGVPFILTGLAFGASQVL